MILFLWSDIVSLVLDVICCGSLWVDLMSLVLDECIKRGDLVSLVLDESVLGVQVVAGLYRVILTSI